MSAGPDLTLVNLSGDPVTGEKVLPLGALAIKTALQGRGFAVELRDLQLLPAFPRDLPALADTLGTDAPVLGLSLMSDRLPEALLALRLFKQRQPETFVVLGGAGPTEVAGPLLEAFPHVDAVVRGEGEETAPALLEALRRGGRADLGQIAGLSARVGGRVVHGPDRPRLRDLDALRAPEDSGWDLTPYDSLSVVTTRGCPFDCSFCSIVAGWGREVRRRSVARTADEIAWLAAAKPGAFLHIEDDTFTLDPKRVRALCAAISARTPALQWGCTARLDLIDEPTIAAMAAAGCRSVFVGVESGSDRVRAGVHKSFPSSLVFERVAMLLRHVEVTCHYIWGYPDESFEELQETFLHIAHLTAMGATARHSHLVPFPRSPLVQRYRGRWQFRETYPFTRLFLLEPGVAWVDEVRTRPEVFAPWFSLETPEEQAKFAFVEAFGRFERAG